MINLDYDLIKGMQEDDVGLLEFLVKEGSNNDWYEILENI